MLFLHFPLRFLCGGLFLPKGINLHFCVFLRICFLTSKSYCVHFHSCDSFHLRFIFIFCVHFICDSFHLRFILTCVHIIHISFHHIHHIISFKSFSSFIHLTVDNHMVAKRSCHSGTRSNAAITKPKRFQIIKRHGHLKIQRQINFDLREVINKKKELSITLHEQRDNKNDSNTRSVFESQQPIKIIELDEIGRRDWLPKQATTNFTTAVSIGIQVGEPCPQLLKSKSPYYYNCECQSLFDMFKSKDWNSTIK